MALFDQLKERYKQLIAPNLGMLAGPLGVLASPQGREQFYKGAEQVRKTGLGLQQTASNLTSSPNLAKRFVGEQVARPVQYAGAVLEDVGLLSSIAAKPKTFFQAPLASKESFLEPGKYSKTSIGLSLLGNVPIGGITRSFKSTPIVSKFRMSAKTLDELVGAEEMIMNPRKYLGSIKTGARNEKQALKKIQEYGVEIVERLSAKYLPDKELETLKTPQAKIKALAILHSQNRLANVPGMGIVGTKKPAQGMKSVKQILEERKLPPEPLKQGSQLIEQGGLTSRPPSEPIVPRGMKERGFVKTVREAETTAEDVATKIKGFYKPITNKETIRKASIAVDTEGWDAVKQRVLKNPLTVDTNAEGLELMRRAQNEKRFDEAIEIAEELAKKGTQAGQTVQAFSIWGRMAPEGMLKYAQNVVMRAQENMGFATKFVRKTLGKGVNIKLTDADAAKITSLMKKANAAGDERIKMQYTKEALEIINSKVPYGVSDFLDEFRYNNMLSNPKSHARNIYNNALNTYLTAPATLIAEGKPVGAMKYLWGTVRGLGDSVTDAFKSIKGDVEILKPDLKELNKGRFPLALSWPTRVLEAQDRFFSGLIKSGMEAAGASAKEADEAAKYFLLRTDLGVQGQGVASQALDRVSKWLYTAPKPVRWFVPFIRTPMNAAKMWIDYSPAGAINIIGNTNKRQQIAKVVLGSMATYVGAQIAAEGRTTWDAPTDQTEKQLFYAAGKKPFSVQIGDRWVPMWYFGPFAFAFALPAAMKHHDEHSRTALADSDMDKIQNAATGLVKFVMGQTPLTGLNTFARLAEGDIDYSIPANLAFTSSQLIPFTGLLNYIARVVDPIYRKPEGFVEQVKSGLPVISKQLKPYGGPFGESSMRVPINKYLPYDVGVRKTEYEPLLNLRNEELQQNAVINKMEKEIEKQATQKTGLEVSAAENAPASTQDLIAKKRAELEEKVALKKFGYSSEPYLVLGEKLYYKTDTGKSSVSLDFDVQEPKYTGNETLDKELLADYRGAITKAKNAVMKAWEVGYLDQDEAIKQLEALKIKSDATKTKKAKKFTFKKVTAPKIKQAKVKKVKVKRPTKTVRSLRASQVKIKAPKINLGAKI